MSFDDGIAGYEFPVVYFALVFLVNYLKFLRKGLIEVSLRAAFASLLTSDSSELFYDFVEEALAVCWYAEVEDFR
jgi:hypothetical protein